MNQIVIALIPFVPILSRSNDEILLPEFVTIRAEPSG
jgi:hypothetical protein